MKKYIANRMSFLWIFFILSTSLSCKKENIQIISDQEELNNIINSFEEYIYENDHSSDYIYDQNKLHRFDLFLTQENLDEINNNPAAENYVEGSLVFEGKVIKNVGIRYKGSIGAWVGCLSNEDWTNPSGYKTCPKLSMKIKINWKGDNKFYGMKKLQFHSQNLDKSKMHERLGYYMFRNFGITAPRSNHALLYINGEFNGVFANTENVDGPFTNKHFINPDGNLYKEVWPVKSSGGNREENYFIDGLKTNEEISDVTKIKRFSDQLGSVNKSDANEIVEDWIDKDLFLKTILVDRRIANDDGFMHFYHEGGVNYENHNYYWYEDPNDDKLQLIPWDLDNSFENLISNLNPVTPIKDKWYETTNNCNGFRYGSFNLLQKSAACDKIIGSFSSYRKDYDSLDIIFQNQLFNMSNINTLLDSWYNQIKNAVEEAHSIHGDKEPSIQEWNDNINYLKYSIDQSLN